ncbi:MAG: hypothetical protein GXZ13_02290 [Synergistaceae bacterium]|nr:hypothetical protein [Synergistaceae bacterium]
MTIKKLDLEISTKIAAGEVIERPSSVAKELIENSIDASATEIIIRLEQGGKNSFVIEDDGVGILFEELPLALERYATSKIEKLDDLENISTLGYRGEALASIASVSRMEIRSRKANIDEGGVIRTEAGKVILHSLIPCKPGTRIQVDDLFFNLPVRRKFLKSASAELRRVIQTVNDYALIHPEKTFRIYSDNKIILEHIPVKDTLLALRKRWGDDTQIYSSKAQLNMVEVKAWWNPIPDSRRVIISLFVNKRKVQDVTVRAAICSGDSVAYGEWLVLIDIPPTEIDVNVHPTKEEVRFRNTQEIFKAVHSCTKNIFLDRYSMDKDIKLIKPISIEGLSTNYDRFASNFNTNTSFFTSDINSEIQPSSVYTQKSYSSQIQLNKSNDTSSYWSFTADKNYIGQTARGFLLFDFPGALAIIDPHAAHEKILYEEIVSNFNETIEIQKLTIPQDIPEALLPEITSRTNELLLYGFEISKNKLVGVPLIRGKGHIAPIEMLRSVLKGIDLECAPEKRDMEVWWRMARLACRDAVKLGQVFTREEALSLLEQLGSIKDPFSCPHGRPSIIIFENKKIEGWFNR